MECLFRSQPIQGQWPATPSGPPVGVAPETDYLLDLDTGEMTPLPEDIVGTRTWWQLCSVTGRVEASLNAG
jgi:hypothetical protein